MKPIYLKLNNFMSHGESFVDFSKLSPAAIIVGIEDGATSVSNAVGKTTLFNAIRFILFDASVTKKSKIIRNGTSKCEVEFVFELELNKRYKIYRSRTKTTKNVNFFELIDDKWVDLSGRTDTFTEKLIIDTIKINQKTFENSSYFKQHDGFNLASATTKQRKDIIRDMLQLDEWLKYEKVAKEAKAELSQEYDVTKGLIDSMGDPEALMNNATSGIRSVNESISKVEININKASEELDDVKSKLLSATKLSIEYPALLSKLTIEKEFSSELERQIRLLSSSMERKEFEETTQMTSISEYKKQIVENKAELEQLNTNIIVSISKEDYSEVENKISEYRSIIDYNESRLKIISKSIPDDDFCPVCYTELNEDNINKALQEKQSRTNKIEKILKEAKENLKISFDKKQQFDISNNTYNKYVDRKLFLENKIKNLDSLYETATINLNNIKESIINTKKELSIKSSQLEDSKKAVINLKEKIRNIEVDSQKDLINKLRAIQSTIELELSTLKSELMKFTLFKGKLNNQFDVAKKDLEKLNELKNNIKILEYDLNVDKAVVKAFGSSGIPAMIITTVLDSLQQETNNVLETLRPGINVQFFIEKERNDGKQEDTLGMRFFVNNNEWDYDDLSGGQQACVALALKFAIAVVNRRRCGADIRLLLLDEVDQALDQFGIDTFYNVVKQWSKHMTILIITHNEQLKNKFFSYILVDKVNGVASAKVVL